MELGQEPVGAARADEIAQHRRVDVGPGAERRRVLAPLGVDDGELAHLPPVAVDDRDPVVGVQGDRGRGAGANPVGLQRPVDRLQAG